MKRRLLRAVALGLVFLGAIRWAPAEGGYLVPPANAVAVLDAARVETPLVSPDRAWVALLERPGLTTLRALASPRRRLAGLLFDTAANADAEVQGYASVGVFPVAGGRGKAIAGLPADALILQAIWSADATRLALLVREDDAVRVWIAHGPVWQARRASVEKVNAAFDAPCAWIGGSRSLVCRFVPPERGPAPAASAVLAPRVQTSDGGPSPVRTEAGLLRSAQDEALFEHYAGSKLGRLDLSGKVFWLPVSGAVTRSTPSPDGRYVLVKRLQPPWSREFRYERFASKIEVRTIDGALVRVIASLPLESSTPIDEDAVRQGARGVAWRADAPATLFWAEAQDGGDANRPAAVRDRAYLLAAPFHGSPRVIGEFGLRMEEIYWSRGDLALVKESWWKTRRAAYWRLRPDAATPKQEQLLSYSTEDRYADPGQPLLRPGGAGFDMLDADDEALYFASSGASAAGERPRLAKLDLADGELQTIWQSTADAYEWPAARLAGDVLLVHGETERIAPHWTAVHLHGGEAAVFGPERGPVLPESNAQLLHYRRGDGLPLSATLVLPVAPFRAPLPAVLIAYPNEFLSAEAAGRVSGSARRFRGRFLGGAALYLSQGFAVIDHAAMPIVSSDGRPPNDSYGEQLVANARAAIEAAVRTGAVDPHRVAVVGHSYGAAMVASLLARSSLFCAGIAMSGAYDRTLTPFGFQTEERTLWQAQSAYLALSPLLAADRMAAPLLLVHGEADSNPGTQPLQSERLFEALRGLGKPARLVILPYEDHVYRARESVLHVAAEALGWLHKSCP